MSCRWRHAGHIAAAAVLAWLAISAPLHAAPAPDSSQPEQPSASQDGDQTLTGVGHKPGVLYCQDADFAQLSRRTWNAMHRLLTSSTRLIGAGSQSLVVLSGPFGDTKLSEMRLRVFFVDENKFDEQHHQLIGGYVPPATEARVLAETLSGSEHADIATKLQVDPASNALLQIDVPNDATDWIYHTRRVVVFACQPGAKGPVLWADMQVMISPTLLPMATGILLCVLLYIFCAWVVYHARLQLAIDKVAKEKEIAARTSLAQQNKVAVPPYPRLADVTKWKFRRCLNPVALTSDIFDQGSLSNLQILFFSLLVSYGLLFIVLRTGELSSISTTVVGLLGISAVGSLGNKLVGTTRDRLSAENWSWLVDRKVLPINDPGKGEPTWRDLVMSDSELDLYKLQALIFSVIVGTGMIVGGFSLATFSVPSELLEVLGLSQLVFVGGRAVKPANLGDLDKLLDELRTRDAALRQAAATGFDVDAGGLPVTMRSKLDPPFATIEAASKADAVPNAALRYLTTERQVKMLLEAWAHRAVDADCLARPSLP